MRNLLLASLLLPACTTSEPTTTVTDNPITAAARGDKIVVAAAEATEQTGFGCGGGQAFLGRSVLFVSGDRGETFERIVPADDRPLVRMASRDGVFYAVAHGNDGSFGVVTSVDGVAWTEVASAQRYAQDFATSDDLMVVAHATGVMTSADGSAWTDHALAGDAYYQASVARTNGMLAIGTNADGSLHLSSDAIAWTQRAIPGLEGIDQVIPDGDLLILAGYGTNRGPVLARVDLASQAAPTIRDKSFATRMFMTPSGLLDTSGSLTAIGDQDFGNRTDHVAPFVTAAVDGSTVVLVRPDSISISRDGGATFDAATLPLPIVKVEIEGETTGEAFGPRG